VLCVARSGSWVILCRALVACALAMLTLSVKARAQGATALSPNAPHIELWSGAEAFHRIWSLYGGGMYAPFGSVREDGFRVRAVAGYSEYARGTVSFADWLVGYHKQFGGLTLKFLTGLTVADHCPDDPQATFHGYGVGGKAVVEAWWNVTNRVWVSTDLSWGSLHQSYGSRARLGWRLWPELSLGLEGGAAGALETDVARVGGFVRYEWASGEVSLSGGLSGDGPTSGWIDVHGPFATLSVLTRF
jgi:Cellulose biosynthesis protein BcsS